MRFHLVDRIVELEPPSRIVVLKTLSRAEEYLADHFPSRPVMPGVMMLQVCVEAGMWLMRASGRARYGAHLREVRNIRYGSFFEPGRQMRAQVRLIGETEGMYSFKAEGHVGEDRVISARLVLVEMSIEAGGRRLARQAGRIEAALDERYALLSGRLGSFRPEGNGQSAAGVSAED